LAACVEGAKVTDNNSDYTRLAAVVKLFVAGRPLWAPMFFCDGSITGLELALVEPAWTPGPFHGFECRKVPSESVWISLSRVDREVLCAEPDAQAAVLDRLLGSEPETLADEEVRLTE
jgi:hypothetical protein